MSKVFNKTLLKKALIDLLLIFAVSKLFWAIISALYLPLSGIEQEPSSALKALPSSYRFASDRALIRKTPHPKTAPQSSIRDLKLLAIYADSKQQIAVIKRRGKPYFLSRGDSIAKYRIQAIDTDSVILKKGMRQYRLSFPKDSSKRQNRAAPYRYKESKSSTLQNPYAKEPSAMPSKYASKASKIVQDGDIIKIPRALIKNSVHNIDKIWKNINIAFQKGQDSSRGLLLRSIKSGSLFEKLGFKRGDIIRAVNGEEIQDSNDLIKLYRSLESLDTLSIIVKRNNQEVELNYEIY